MTRCLLQTGSLPHVATGRNLKSYSVSQSVSEQFSHTPKLFQSPFQMRILWTLAVCAEALNMGNLSWNLLEDLGITGTLAVGLGAKDLWRQRRAFGFCSLHLPGKLLSSDLPQRLRQGQREAQFRSVFRAVFMLQVLYLFVPDHSFEEAE